MRWILLAASLLGFGLVLGGASLSLVYPVALNQPPARSLAPPVAFDAAPAYLAMPFVIPVDEVMGTVREALSEQLFAERVRVPGRNIEVEVERDGDLVLWLRRGRLHMELPIEFDIEGDLDTSGSLTLITDARFDISPDWHPALNVKSGFEWGWQPRVGFWPFRIRIGDRLQPYIQKALDKESEKLEQAARERFKLRQLAETGWRQLQMPIALRGATPQWLLLRPHAAWLEPITNDASDIRINLWLGAQPQVLESEQPPAAGALPLPVLQRGKPPANRLVLDHRLALSYADAAAAMQAGLGEFNLPEGQAAVERLELYPAGERLAFALTLRGRRAGAWWQDRARLFGTGELVYDPAQEALRLTGLQLAPTRFNPFGWRTRWIERSLPMQPLAQAARWPMAEAIAARQQWLDGELARVDASGFDLWGGLSGTQPTRAQLLESGISFGLRSYGEMAVMFNP